MKRITQGIVVGLLLASRDAHASSLPQMDPTWFANQLLWLAVSFGLLYAMVSLFIAPSIQSVLRTRETAISNAIHEAERAKRAAETTRSDADSTGFTARAKAAEMMAQAQAKNTAEAAEAISKLDRDLARRAEQAAVVLEEAVVKAAAGIDAAAKELASVMTAQLLAPASNR